MRVAISSEGKNLGEHFGHCSEFTIYDIENNKVNNTEVIENPGHKPGFLPEFLSKKNVNVIISGGMGKRAQELFKNNKIEVIVGAEGLCDDIIQSFIDGKLHSTNSICNKHEFEGHCND